MRSFRLSVALRASRLLLAVATVTLAAQPAAVLGQDVGPPITRVEEDWVLLIDEPDLNINSPQIATVLSPLSHIRGIHVVFELNHITLGEYAPGGMQLQCWHDDYNMAWQNFPEVKPLHVTNETLTYTNTMELKEGKLIFEVTNGQSETWGKFGGQGYLRFMLWTNTTELTDYSPDVSVKYSKVGYGANRVKKYCLKEVRYYSNGVLIETDKTERVVHQTPSVVASAE